MPEELAISADAPAAETPAATPATETPSAPMGLDSFYGENGLNHDAVAKLPESAAAFKGMLQKYPSPEAFYGGVKNLQFLAGQKSLTKLGPDATDAEKHQHDTMVKEYFGVPDHVEGYGVKKPDNIPDEVWDEKGTGELLSILHQHNASPELVQALAQQRIGQFEALMADAPNQEAARVEQINTELKESFGNDLQQVTADAVKGLTALGVQVPESGNIADLKISYTDILKAGQRMTELISEDVMALESRRDASGSTAGSYLEQANDIKTNPHNPFYVTEKSSIEAQRKSQAEFQRLMKFHTQLKG